MSEPFGLTSSSKIPAKSNLSDSLSSPPEDSVDSSKGNIKVVCRFRPLNERELNISRAFCVEFLPDSNTVGIPGSQESGPLKFTFDAVFPPDSTQSSVYDFAARPTVESVLEGFNGTVFAYGQTGSGKTYTMTGPNVDDEEMKGVIPRMVNTVFSKISVASDDLEFSVKVGYAEIYMEKIKDLLEPANSNLKIHEEKSRGVYIAGLTEQFVSNETEVYKLMKLGAANREVGATLMNEGSSRSHSLFILTISQSSKSNFSAKTGKLYLVDLAGSEKVGKTGAEGKRLDEAKTINKSLSTLGLVINSLTDGKSTHVPYRDSRLTRVLQDSLGGNSKTALIVTCSPSPYNEAETVSTLRFGIRAKAIKNKPKINREFSIPELKLLLAKAEAELIKRETIISVLKKRLLNAGGTLPTDQDLMEFRETEEKEDKIDFANAQLLEMEELTQEMDMLREQIEEMRRVNEDVAESLRTEMDGSARLKTENDNLRMNGSALNLRIRSLEDAGKDMEDEKTRLMVRIQGLEEEVARLHLPSPDSIPLSDFPPQPEQFPPSKSATLPIPQASPQDSEVLQSKDREIRSLQTKLELQESVLHTIETSSGDARIMALLESRHSTGPVSTEPDWRGLLESERGEKERISLENERLEVLLQSVLEQQMPDCGQVLKELVESRLMKEKQVWITQWNLIERDLANRVQKVVDLEMELDNMKETNSLLLASLGRGDKRYLRMKEQEYYRVFNENKVLSTDLSIQLGKVIRLEDRLRETELNLEEVFRRMEDAQKKSKEQEKHYEEVRGRTSIKSLNMSQHIEKRITGGSKPAPMKEVERTQPFDVREEDRSARDAMGIDLEERRT